MGAVTLSLLFAAIGGFLGSIGGLLQGAVLVTLALGSRWRGCYRGATSQRLMAAASGVALFAVFTDALAVLEPRLVQVPAVPAAVAGVISTFAAVADLERAAHEGDAVVVSRWCWTLTAAAGLALGVLAPTWMLWRAG